MIDLDNFTLISPDYEDKYEMLYGRQPKYIPVGFISNNDVIPGVEVRRYISRIWVRNKTTKNDSTD